VINSDFDGFKVVWTRSVVQPYSSGVPLYWTAYVTYTNISSSSLTLGCPGDWADASFVAEHMSGGSGDDGTVSAESDTCSQDPGVLIPVSPGGTWTSFATFHNVPWPGSAVSITWGDAGTSSWAYPFGPPSPSVIHGEACVFNAPSGVTTIGGDVIGHVGWGFELPSGYWEFGANEGPGNLLISKTWYATGTWEQMLMAFRDSGYYHSRMFYTQYRCTNVLTTSADIAAAGATVNREYHEVYIPPGQDCESQDYNVLTAYGVRHLPGDITLPDALSPNTWFKQLSGAGFSRPVRL
jgi:hypothetical protein